MQETVSTRVNGSPKDAFARVTDIAGLPEWNLAITEVLEQPEQLTPGSVWKVRLHALGQSWVSKSTLLALDETEMRFRYRSQSDDGNPSYADWDWTVQPDGPDAKVIVSVDLQPITFWRKHLLVRLRRPSLHKEMQASLVALATDLSS